jgi:hypothetical protein
MLGLFYTLKKGKNSNITSEWEAERFSATSAQSNNAGHLVSARSLNAKTIASAIAEYKNNTGGGSTFGNALR